MVKKVQHAIQKSGDDLKIFEVPPPKKIITNMF